MSYFVETDLSQVDALLGAAKARQPHLRFNGNRNDFKDPTFYIRDTNSDGMWAFSLRGIPFGQSGYWEGTWAASEEATDDKWPLAESIALMTLARDTAGTLWGNGVKDKFNAVYNENCPWIDRQVIAAGDTSAIDIAVEAINTVFPGINTMVRLDPPQNMIIPGISGQKIDLGLVYAHSVPILIDRRGEGEIGV